MPMPATRTAFLQDFPVGARVTVNGYADAGPMRIVRPTTDDPAAVTLMAADGSLRVLDEAYTATVEPVGKLGAVSHRPGTLVELADVQAIATLYRDEATSYEVERGADDVPADVLYDFTRPFVVIRPGYAGTSENTDGVVYLMDVRGNTWDVPAGTWAHPADETALDAFVDRVIDHTGGDLNDFLADPAGVVESMPGYTGDDLAVEYAAIIRLTSWIETMDEEAKAVEYEVAAGDKPEDAARSVAARSRRYQRPHAGQPVTAAAVLAAYRTLAARTASAALLLPSDAEKAAGARAAGLERVAGWIRTADGDDATPEETVADLAATLAMLGAPSLTDAERAEITDKLTRTGWCCVCGDTLTWTRASNWQHTNTAWGPGTTGDHDPEPRQDDEDRVQGL